MVRRILAVDLVIKTGSTPTVKRGKIGDKPDSGADHERVTDYLF